MRWRNAAAVWVLSVVFIAVPLVEYASADPIVIVPNGGLGWVDTTVTDPGEPGGSDASGSGATRGSARGSGMTCTYTPVGLASLGTDLAESLVGPIGGLNGLRMGFFARSCSDGSLDIVWRDPFALGGGPAGDVVVTPGQLAQVAYSRLRLPAPRARFNPARQTSAGLATTVHIPTWWWVEDWSTHWQRTSAGAVWAQVTARPVRTQWDPGDGGRPVACEGPGVPWRAGLADSASPCKYVYRTSSAAEPDLSFNAVVTVEWAVSWVGSGGASGTLPPMSTTTTFPVAVTERQSVVVGSGGGQG